MFPIKFNCFPAFAPAAWPQILVNWLGHAWSYCTSHLSNLMQRVSGAASNVFSTKEKAAPPADKDTSTPNTPVVETPRKQEDTAIDPLAPAVHPEQNHIQSLPPEQKRSEPPNKIDAAEDEPNIDLEELFGKSEPAPGIQPKTDQPNEQDRIIVVPDEGGRRRRRKRQKKTIPLREFQKQQAPIAPPPLRNNSTAEAAAPATSADAAPATEKPPVPPALEPLIIECGGGGDCQLHALLKGLEMQHPEIAKYEKEGKSLLYTDLDLRKMGVNFAREQVDKYGVFAEEILSYLDTDRKEHNDSAVTAVQKNQLAENEKLDKALKEKKLNRAVYDKQKKALVLKYQRIADHLEKNVVINTDEEFLNRLEKKGFYCSTLHLFSLSFLLKVPIFVLEQHGIPGHDIQRFNPADSKLDPVYLYRVGRCHYQLIVHPK